MLSEAMNHNQDNIYLFLLGWSNVIEAIHFWGLYSLMHTGAHPTSSVRSVRRGAQEVKSHC